MIALDSRFREKGGWVIAETRFVILLPRGDPIPVSGLRRLRHVENKKEVSRVGLVVFFFVAVVLGYGICYFFHVRPLKEHNKWLNTRLGEEHRSRMELYDQAGTPVVMSSITCEEGEGAG